MPDKQVVHLHPAFDNRILQFILKKTKKIHPRNTTLGV